MQNRYYSDLARTKNSKRVHFIRNYSIPYYSGLGKLYRLMGKRHKSKKHMTDIWGKNRR